MFFNPHITHDIVGTEPESRNKKDPSSVQNQPDKYC